MSTSRRFPSGAWGEARRAIAGQRGLVALGLGCALANGALALVPPAGAKYVIDDVVGGGRPDLLPAIGAVVVGAVLLQAGAAFGLHYSLGLAAQRAIAALRRELQARVVRLPLAAFDDTPSGAFVARILTDPEQLRTVVGPGLVQLASGLLTATLALGVLFWLDPALTAVLVVLFGAALLELRRGFGRLYPAFHDLSALTAEMTGRLAEALGGIRVVKAFRAERREAYRFARESHRLLRRAVRAVAGVAAFGGASVLVTGGVGAFVLVAGAGAVAAGRMTVGDLVLYLLFVGLLWTPLVHLAAFASEAGKAFGALGRIAELRALDTEEEADRMRAPVPRVDGAVAFEDVTYTYPNGRTALRNVCFSAPAGSLVGIMGPNGSGKSTLCYRLLLAADRPTSGRVLIDGRDLARLRRREYRRHVAVVPQETILFDGTIEDNIRYGRPGATAAEFRRAVRLAHCEEFVSRLPLGYRTPVGERGLKLSGGERQRVAIARAILADPRILILDEPTAHLDAESAAAVEEALAGLCAGRTTFVIGHGATFIRKPHQTLVLERGWPQVRGGFEAVLCSGGDLWKGAAQLQRQSCGQIWKRLQISGRSLCGHGSEKGLVDRAHCG